MSLIYRVRRTHMERVHDSCLDSVCIDSAFGQERGMCFFCFASVIA